MWKLTAFETMVLTSGTRPAAADIMKLVEPWQCTTALISFHPVSFVTAATAAGWSYSAA